MSASRLYTAIVQMNAVSQRVYGRLIPKALLTHVGRWRAVILPEVVTTLGAAGARYLTLAQVRADAAS
jgi:hypothetical protein